MGDMADYVARLPSRYLAPADVDVLTSWPGRVPAPSGAEAGAVPPVGLEPTTFGLKVRRPVIVWIEYIGVLATHWLTTRATVSRQSLPHQLAQLAYHDPTAARLPLD